MTRGPGGRVVALVVTGLLVAGCSGGSEVDEVTPTTARPRVLEALPRDLEGRQVVAGHDAGYLIESGNRQRLFRIEPTGRILDLGSLEVAGITNTTWFAGHLLAFRVRCLDPSPESIDCPGRSIAELTRVAPDGRVASTTRVGFWKLDGGEANVSLIGAAGPKTLWVRTDRLVEIDPEGHVVSRVASEHAGACAIGGRLFDLVGLPSEDVPEPRSFEVLEWRDQAWHRVRGSEVGLLSGTDHIECRDGRYELERVNQRPLKTWTPTLGWRDVEVSAPRHLHGPSSTGTQYTVDEELRLPRWVPSGRAEPTGISFEPQPGEGRPSSLTVDDAGGTLIACVATGDPSGNETRCEVRR